MSKQEMENMENEEILDNEDLPEPGIIEGQDDNHLDLPEETEEEEVEEEAEEDEEPKKGKHWSRDKALLDKIRRDNYRYAAQIQELQSKLMQEQNESSQLRQLNEKATKIALENYELATKREVDRAKDMRRAAYESGDAGAMAETEDALTKAIYEHQRVMGIKAEEDYRYKQEEERYRQAEEYQKYNPPQPQSGPVVPNLSEENYLNSEQWVHQNDWFDAKSPNFDPQRQELANRVIDNIDNYCYQNGMAHLIGSPQYFEAVDQQLGQMIESPKPREQRQHMQTQPRQQRSIVAPARGRSIATNPNGSLQRNAKPLNPQHASMAKRLGIKESEYRKYIEKSEKNDYLSDQISQNRGRK